MYLKCQVQILKHSLLCRFIWFLNRQKSEFLSLKQQDDYRVFHIRPNLTQVYVSKFYTTCRDWSVIWFKEHLQIIRLGLPPLSSLIIDFSFPLIFILNKGKKEIRGPKTSHTQKMKSFETFRKYKYLRLNKNNLIEDVKSQKVNRISAQSCRGTYLELGGGEYRLMVWTVFVFQTFGRLVKVKTSNCNYYKNCWAALKCRMAG